MLIDEVGMMSRLLLDNNIIISIVTGLGGALIIQVGALLLQNKKDKAEAPNKKAEAEKTASEIAIALIAPYREQINDPNRSDYHLANANLTMELFNKLNISEYRDAGRYDSDPISSKVFSYYEEKNY